MLRYKIGRKSSNEETAISPSQKGGRAGTNLKTSLEPETGECTLSLSEGHNSDGDCEQVQPDLPFRLSGSQKKTAFALRANAQTMIDEAGVECCGFLTLTVGEKVGKAFRQVKNSDEASKRINNLNRHVLPALFERAIIVTERHKSGAIHFHLVGVLRGRPDIRTGFNFEAVKGKDYRSVSWQLRAIWEHLRTVLPDYGFGRAELTPIRKTGAAVASYVAKYVEKNLFNRIAEDRKKKLVRYLGWAKRHLKPNDFSWATPRASAWRVNAAKLSALVGVRDRSEVAECFGPRWAFHLSRVMNSTAGNDRHVAELSQSFPLRETARSLVNGIASRRWMAARAWENSGVPISWKWCWRSLTQRRQLQLI